MKARPILFSGPMVRALLDGRKTQTRRIIKPQPVIHSHGGYQWDGKLAGFVGMMGTHWEGFKECAPWHCPYGKRGDLLWVRETWGLKNCGKRVSLQHAAWPKGWPEDRLIYQADADVPTWEKRVSIHMPRWANRITLEITGVRVERLQDISDKDAIVEGILVGEPIPEIPDSKGDIYHDGFSDQIDGWTRDPVEAYRNIWVGLSDEESWDLNPWVWVVEFKVHKCNVDIFLNNREAA